MLPSSQPITLLPGHIGSRSGRKVKKAHGGCSRLELENGAALVDSRLIDARWRTAISWTENAVTSRQYIPRCRAVLSALTERKKFNLGRISARFGTTTASARQESRTMDSLRSVVSRRCAATSRGSLKIPFGWCERTQELDQFLVDSAQQMGTEDRSRLSGWTLMCSHHSNKAEARHVRPDPPDLRKTLLFPAGFPESKFFQLGKRQERVVVSLWKRKREHQEA